MIAHFVGNETLRDQIQSLNTGIELKNLFIDLNQPPLAFLKNNDSPVVIQSETIEEGQICFNNIEFILPYILVYSKKIAPIILLCLFSSSFYKTKFGIPFNHNKETSYAGCSFLQFPYWYSNFSCILKENNKIDNFNNDTLIKFLDTINFESRMNHLIRNLNNYRLQTFYVNKLNEIF
jgi:hypothetical protein